MNVNSPFGRLETTLEDMASTDNEYSEITSLQVEIAECAEKLQCLHRGGETNDSDPLARLEEAERLVSRLETAGTKLTRIKATSAMKRQEALATESEENKRLDDARREREEQSRSDTSSSVEPISIVSSPNQVTLQKVSLQVQAPAPQLPQRQEQPFNLGAPILSSSSSVTRGASFRISSSPPSTGNSLQRFTPIVSSTSNLPRGPHVDVPELSLPDLRSPLRGRFSADIMASREQVSRRIRPTAPIQTPMRQQQHLQPSVPSTATPFESRNYISMMGPAPLPQDKAIARGGGSGGGGGGGGASLSNSGNSNGAPSSLQSIPNRPIPFPSASSNSSIFPQTQQSLPQSTQNPPQQLPQEALAYAALYYYYAALATAAQGPR